MSSNHKDRDADDDDEGGNVDGVDDGDEFEKVEGVVAVVGAFEDNMNDNNVIVRRSIVQNV